MGLLALGFVIVISSLSYDESNPRDRPNSYYSFESVVIDRPVAEVFRFVQHEIPSIYTRMSPMHEKFEILNAEALVGAPGAGGSFAFGDADTRVGYAYLMNKLDFHLADDPREKALRDAVYPAVG